MFRVKICGITREEDARVAREAGADAIGLNFYSKSPRCVLPKQAHEIAQVMIGAHAVGVFVNMPPNEIMAIVNGSWINTVQLHGDEPPSALMNFPGVGVVRARRMDDRGVAAIAEDLKACQDAGRAPDAVLVDAAAPGQYGGTGETVSWPGLVDHPRWLAGAPLILAGGLTPDNVAEAIRIVRPHGVDVASGVESSPGVKDPAKVRDFVSAAKEAFENL